MLEQSEQWRRWNNTRYYSSFFIVDFEEVFAPLNIEQRVEIVKICH